jgi:hypothetical protein
MPKKSALCNPVSFPCLEIYGHWSEDASKRETTVLIGLQGN